MHLIDLLTMWLEPPDLIKCGQSHLLFLLHLKKKEAVDVCLLLKFSELEFPYHRGEVGMKIKYDYICRIF